LTAQVIDFGLSIFANNRITIEELDSNLEALLNAVNKGEISTDEYYDKEFNLNQDYDLSQPLATSSYAAPEVVKYIVQRQCHNILKNYFSLYEDFIANKIGVDWLYYGAQLAVPSNYLEGNDPFTENYTQLLCDAKDDMFSAGITLFMLITGHYPCANDEHNVDTSFSIGCKPAYKLKYLSIDAAVAQFPLIKQFEPLIHGLLAPTRGQRLDSTQALLEFNQRLHQVCKKYKPL
jgi:hypothetical protein